MVGTAFAIHQSPRGRTAELGTGRAVPARRDPRQRRPTEAEIGSSSNDLRTVFQGYQFGEQRESCDPAPQIKASRSADATTATRRKERQFEHPPTSTQCRDEMPGGQEPSVHPVAGDAERHDAAAHSIEVFSSPGCGTVGGSVSRRSSLGLLRRTESVPRVSAVQATDLPDIDSKRGDLLDGEASVRGGFSGPKFFFKRASGRPGGRDALV